MKLRDWLALIQVAVLLMATQVAVAEPGGNTLRPFVAGSMSTIKAEHVGKPFVLSVWSLSCAYCGDELVMLSEMKKKYPVLSVVTVSTDSIDDRMVVSEELVSRGHADGDNWVFADAFIERLRAEIDPKWHGELPRTYFFDGRHRARAVSGQLKGDVVEKWIRRQFGK